MNIWYRDLIIFLILLSTSASVNLSFNCPNFTYKSLVFEINKKIDINELRQFIIILQNLGFKSSKQRNTTVQLIDITENNSHIYYEKINYNKIENDNEELKKQPSKKYKRVSSIYNQIELYTKTI